MSSPSEGRGLIARAIRFAESQYTSADFDEAQKLAESIERAGGDEYSIAAAYVLTAVKRGMIDADYVREVFGDEVERHTRE